VPDIVDLPGHSLLLRALPDRFLRIERHGRTSIYPFAFWIPYAGE
jgi:hypothetical protein